MHTCHTFKNSDIDFFFHPPKVEKGGGVRIGIKQKSFTNFRIGFFPQDLSSIWIPTSVVKFTDDRFAGFLHYLHNGK